MSNTTRLFAVLIALSLAACAAQPDLTPTEDLTSAPEPTTGPADTPSGPGDATVPPEQPGAPLLVQRGDLFATSGVCAACHTNMTDESGQDVSIDSYWRSTMMANSSRDVYWQASVRGETIANPHLQAIIEDKCATCHTPMARTTAVAGGAEGSLLLDGGLLDPANDLNTLAMDGISCTLCHQIEDIGFGERESFSGHYEIDVELPVGERLTYGPLPVDQAQAAVMQSGSGYIPVESKHIEQSELCATCHTLYTPYVDAEGEVQGEFPEQMNYNEWLNSSHPESTSCQGCHMPLAQGGVQLSITGGEPRSPFFRHAFVGGNNYMLSILRAAGDELGATASSAHFDATIERMTEQMQTRAAFMVIKEASVSGGQLTAAVTVTNLAGHKFPSGFPSRRIWLHITVKDANGDVVFESGAVNQDGSIVGNDNDDDPAAYEPHYLEITEAGQVQIYETIMGTTDGEPTTTLLRAAVYLKDNRLLPAGFDKEGASEDIAVYGQAADDADFTGDGDTVRYVIDVGDAQGPFTVTVELLYQSIGYRWAQNLAQYDADEVARFFDYYERIPNLPVIVYTVTVDVEE